MKAAMQTDLFGNVIVEGEGSKGSGVVKKGIAVDSGSKIEPEGLAQWPARPFRVIKESVTVCWLMYV
jgi:hypothetical protein